MECKYRKRVSRGKVENHEALNLVMKLLLSGYLIFIWNGQNSVNVGTPQPILIKLFSIPVILLLVNYIVDKLAGLSIKSEADSGFSKKMFLLTFGAGMIVLLVWLAAYWPGGFAVDTIQQWEQAHTGIYDDWHPVLHTLLFITLPTKVLDIPVFPVMLQMVYFSLALAYLTCTLKRHGCPTKICVAMNIFILISPVNGKMMVYLLKDAALSIFLIILLGYFVRILMTKGKWLESRRNLIALILIIAVSSIMRHNALLFTFSVLGVLWLLNLSEWKRILFVTVGSILVIGAVKGVLYPAMGVTAPGQRQAEMLGMPMTILASVYDKAPESLGEEATEFMEKIAPWEELSKYYETGNWGSVKFKFNANPVVEEAGAAKVLQYTWEAVKAEPIVSMRAFLKLTDILWATEGNETVDIGVLITDNNFGIEYKGIDRLRTEIENYGQVTKYSIMKYVFWLPGVMVVLVLFLAVSRVKQSGLRGILIILPLLAYDFGTMLLLSDNQLRYFHINFIYLFPALYLLFVERGSDCSSEREFDNLS